MAKAGGFSLHTGVAAERGQQKKLERLARYVTRRARSEQRLSLTSQRLVRYKLKTPSRDCNTHMFFEPVDFMGYVRVPHLGRGDLRSYKSVVLPICHGLARRAHSQTPRQPHSLKS
ncbi:MAG: transposase, partial [Gammaproteobacteria bacterium]